MNRFDVAAHIWGGGASNPRGVARSLVTAIDEAVEENGGSDGAKDPAVQLIIDHLAFLCGLPQPTCEIGPEAFKTLITAVRENCTEKGRGYL
jgi:hypothetical protein